MYYCWWKKSCSSWSVAYPTIFKVLHIPGGAGFLPSTVPPQSILIEELVSQVITPNGQTIYPTKTSGWNPKQWRFGRWCSFLMDDFQVYHVRFRWNRWNMTILLPRSYTFGCHKICAPFTPWKPWKLLRIQSEQDGVKSQNLHLKIDIGFMDKILHPRGMHEYVYGETFHIVQATQPFLNGLTVSVSSSAGDSKRKPRWWTKSSWWTYIWYVRGSIFFVQVEKSTRCPYLNMSRYTVFFSSKVNCKFESLNVQGNGKILQLLMEKTYRCHVIPNIWCLPLFQCV